MLIYDIGHEILHGTIAGKEFFFRAYSGGGRGSRLTRHGVGTLSSWDPRTQENENKGIRGGPLPPGIYKCVYQANRPGFHECVFLQPVFVPNLGTRGPFLIHGRGKKGSDGCIVPVETKDRETVIAAIKDHPGTMLKVVNPYFIPEGRTLPSNVA